MICLTTVSKWHIPLCYNGTMGLFANTTRQRINTVVILLSVVYCFMFQLYFSHFQAVHFMNADVDVDLLTFYISSNTFECGTCQL
jgi:hypothetical protein